MVIVEIAGALVRLPGSPTSKLRQSLRPPRRQGSTLPGKGNAKMLCLSAMAR
jgi:hypothetical protein